MSQQSLPQPYIEDEIELREIILFLWQGKAWIVGGALLGLILALLTVALRPASYTSKAWIYVRTAKAPQNLSLSERQPQLRFAASLQEIEGIVNSELWIQTYVPGFPLDQVKRQVDAKNTSQREQQTSFSLQVTAATAQEAYTWTQKWAQAVIQWYTQWVRESLISLQNIRKKVYRTYQKESEAYQQFLAQDPRVALRVQLEALQQKQACIVKRQLHFSLILTDVEDLYQRWQAIEEFTATDALLYLTLQQRAYSGAPCGDGERFTLQISDTWMVPMTKEAALQRLQVLRRYVAQRLEQEQQALQQVESEQRRVQTALEQATLEARTLKTRREQAWELWRQFNQQLQTLEADLQMHPPAQILVPPTMPERPDSRPFLLILLVGSFLGAFLGLMGYGLRRTLAQESSSSG